ncbi:ectopic P granules protein 5 homolog [Penaeus indicus]|uniref:ectopic P granules protein 5 homolog n=1 Tax=Penaeus indicus TaxID=29960 RepID=UPI00300C045A
MAEAVRKKRTRIKKKVQEKCPVEDAKEEDCKEDPLMQELLDTYGDTPLPVLKDEEDQNVEDERQETEVKEESDLLVDEKSVVKHVEKVVEVSDTVETIFHDDDSLLADRGNLAEAVKTDVVDDSSAYRVHWEVAPEEPSAPNFENLRQQLVQIEPYMEAQRQMKELMIEDATAKEYSESAICPSAPIIDGGDIQYADVGASAPCLAEDDAIAESEGMSQYPSATAPLLSDPVLSGATYSVDSQVRIEEESSHIKTKITLSEDSVIKPMTDVQINALYQNNELEENEKYIIKFLEEERNVPQLEFYELVLNYLRSRTSLISSQKELSTILEEYRKQMKNIWVFEKRTGTEEGECEDGRLLTVKHEYEVACFKEEIVTHVAKQLKQSRELLSESYALHAYTSEMAKLQVENHMQKILSDCPEFMQVPKNAKIKASGTNEYNPHMQPHIKKLKMCISVLFAFQRRGVKDQQFIRDTRQWLTDFVAILQRFATRSDHLFLLNHILRCPAGVGSWASAYIQIGGPWETDIIGRVLGCWPLDHSLTVLSTILSPVSSREDFLHHLKQSALPSGDPCDENTGDERASDTVWVVVDSSGEEEEDPTQLWAMFTENDVVQLLNQVPFKDIFQHMLMIEDVDGSLQYDVSRTSHHGLMKLFACATVLINLFCKGLSTYSMMRYRGATKRICRPTTAHSRLLNQVPFKDIFQHMLMIEDVDGSLQYDVSRTSHHGLMKLFACATVLINLFCKGLSTYSMMRYRGATKRICRLLRHTVEYVTDHWQNFLLLYQSSPQQISDMNQASTHWTSLQVEYDQLFEKAVHSIISSPRSGAWQFLAVIPYRSVSLSRLWKIVYQIHVGWSEESVQNSEKLSAEKASYSDWADLVSHSDTRGQFHDRLMKIEENEALYLLTALANMAVERESTESHFVEVIVNNIFEATFVNEGTREALSRIGRDLLSSVASNHPISVSYLLTTTQEKISSVGNMALYLFRALPLELWEPSPDDITCVSHWLLFTPVASVENQLARIVLSKLNWGENTFGMQLFLPLELHRRVALTVLEAHLKVSREMRQGSLLTEGVKQVTSVMYAPSAEQVFCDWSWEILTCLRLHQLDQPEPWVHAVIASPALMLKDIPDPTNSAIAQGSSLNAVKRGLMDKQPLALFSALLLTSWGHSIPEFCEHGIDCIHELVMQGMYEAAIASMAHIMPLFFNQPEDITTHSKMMIAIQKCLTADQTYMTLAKSLVTSAFPGKILSLFAAMIVHHIKNYSRYCLSSGMLAVRFWQQMLVGVPDWVHDSNVLFLLDTICQHAFIQPQCWQEAISGFSEIMKNSDYQHNGGSGLSGLLSWLTSGTAAPNSLLVRSSAPQFPWFTIAVLSLETQGELASGLWKNLLLELYADPQTTLEVALKKVSKELGLGQVSSSLLSIYRWGQQVVDLPADHPALPITMQMYFMLHLARVPPQPRQYECSSVINCFYQGFVNQSFLNKIKKKVTAALEHHEAVMAKESDEDEKDASHNVQIAERVKLLRAMQSWLEESRLYDSGVYLPALPPNLLPKKLMQVFQANWEPWPEAVDVDATEEAGRRLLRYPPQPPPPIPPMSPLHLPHIHDSTLTDQDALLYLVQRYTGLVVEHSQTVNLWCSELCALDCVYRELVPQLWSNAHTKTILTAACTPPKVGRKQPECSGHASIVMEFSEARLNEGIKVRIGQNREQHDVVLQRCQKPPPLQLCQAAVSLEAIITVLVNEFRRTDKNTNKQKWQFLLANGRQLFYHIVQLTSDDTSFYPPAKQLISSCAGILGQEFVRGHPDCQESLVAQVLEWGGKLGGLLAPHFTPSVTPKHVFLMLYSTLSPYAPSAPDHTFMLLSKFDIERWLAESSPNSSDRSELINTIAAAFMSLLPGPNPTLLMVLELYRVHLRSLLSFKFPEHYTEVLNVMLQISASTQEDCGGVSSGLWYDLMNKISVGITTFSPEMERNALNQAIKEYAQHQTILSQCMVEDTLKMLSSYFVKQRLEFGLYGLYPKYRLHTQPIATFLGLISHAYIISAFHTKYGTPQEEMVREVWSGVDSLFAGWVTPLGGRDRQSFSPWLRHLTHDIRLLLPWAPSDTTSADAMVAMFAASVGFMHELLPAILTSVWLIGWVHKDTHVMCYTASHSSAEDCGGVSSGLWYDLMNKISVGITTFSPEMERNALNQAIKEYAQHQTILSQCMVEDTLKMLSSYFVKQRLEFGLYGLYPKYRLHTQPIATFLGLISHAYIISAFHTKYGTPQEEMVREVWSGVDSLFAGWVTPLGGRDRQSFSPWLRHLTHDIRLLLPWAPSDTTSADAMVAMFAASVGFMHELLPGSSVLSLTLEYYCTMFAAQEVKSHVLAVIHAHFSALPWHHLHPSLQDTLIFTKVVEQYLPECHNFIGGVLVQINWNKVVQSAMSPTSSSSSAAEVQGQGQEAPSAVKLHTCLLNLLVRISMEPSVRQSSLLQTLLLEAESFSWWLVDSESFQRVVNWWVMSCDPRIVLALPDRNPVDIAIIQLLHRAAGYTPDTTSFHQDTPAKRGLLVRALVRLVTTAAARHKALLSAKPQVFNSTILGLLTHMENTLTATVPKEHQWGEGSILGTELLAVVSGGASSTALQELSSEAVTSWLATQPHPSPGLLLPLVASASRTILHLNHRNPILHAGLSALFSKGDWCGWEGEVTWEHMIGILSFPLTNPTAMLTLAAQEGHLLVVYAYARWRRQQVAVTTDSFLQLTTLFDLLEIVTPNETTELELILLLSEILNLIVHLVKEKDNTSALWQHCRNFISHLALWAEDRSTIGILAAIGLGRQSPLSLAIRLICRALSTFLNLQMPKEGVFRTHPLHTHSDIDETQDSIKNDRCTLEQLRGLTANATYAGVSHSLTKTIQFVEDPTHCISDVTTLLAELVTDLIPHPLLHHLTTTAKNRASGGPPQAAHSSQHFLPEAQMCPSVSSTSASAPPPDDE